MARADCITCGGTLSYSHPALEAKGLFSPAWTAYLERRYGRIGMRCLSCVGRTSCQNCSAHLGDIGTVAGGRDNERDIFCGTEFCVDCVKKEIGARKATTTRRRTSAPTGKLRL